MSVLAAGGRTMMRDTHGKWTHSQSQHTEEASASASIPRHRTMVRDCNGSWKHSQSQQSTQPVPASEFEPYTSDADKSVNLSDPSYSSGYNLRSYQSVPPITSPTASGTCRSSRTYSSVVADHSHDDTIPIGDMLSSPPVLNIPFLDRAGELDDAERITSDSAPQIPQLDGVEDGLLLGEGDNLAGEEAKAVAESTFQLPEPAGTDDCARFGGDNEIEVDRKSDSETKSSDRSDGSESYIPSDMEAPSSTSQAIASVKKKKYKKPPVSAKSKKTSTMTKTPMSKPRPQKTNIPKRPKRDAGGSNCSPTQNYNDGTNVVLLPVRNNAKRLYEQRAAKARPEKAIPRSPDRPAPRFTVKRVAKTPFHQPEILVDNTQENPFYTEKINSQTPAGKAIPQKSTNPSNHPEPDSSGIGNGYAIEHSPEHPGTHRNTSRRIASTGDSDSTSKPKAKTNSTSNNHYKARTSFSDPFEIEDSSSDGARIRAPAKRTKQFLGQRRKVDTRPKRSSSKKPATKTAQLGKDAKTRSELGTANMEPKQFTASNSRKKRSVTAANRVPSNNEPSLKKQVQNMAKPTTVHLDPHTGSLPQEREQPVLTNKIVEKRDASCDGDDYLQSNGNLQVGVLDDESYNHDAETPSFSIHTRTSPQNPEATKEPIEEAAVAPKVSSRQRGKSRCPAKKAAGKGSNKLEGNAAQESKLATKPANELAIKGETKLVPRKRGQKQDLEVNGLMTKRVKPSETTEKLVQSEKESEEEPLTLQTGQEVLSSDLSSPIIPQTLIKVIQAQEQDIQAPDSNPRLVIGNRDAEIMKQQLEIEQATSTPRREAPAANSIQQEVLPSCSTSATSLAHGSRGGGAEECPALQDVSPNQVLFQLSQSNSGVDSCIQPKPADTEELSQSESHSHVIPMNLHGTNHDVSLHKRDEPIPKSSILGGKVERDNQGLRCQTIPKDFVEELLQKRNSPNVLMEERAHTGIAANRSTNKPEEILNQLHSKSQEFAKELALHNSQRRYKHHEEPYASIYQADARGFFQKQQFGIRQRDVAVSAITSVASTNEPDHWQKAVDAASTGLANTMHNITSSLLQHLFTKEENLNKIVDEYKRNGRNITTKLLQQQKKELDEVSLLFQRDFQKLSSAYGAASDTVKGLRVNLLSKQKLLDQVAAKRYQHLHTIRDTINAGRDELQAL